VIIAVALVAVLDGAATSSSPLRIDVFAKQYMWHFGYPSEGNGFSKELHVPVDREVELVMYTQDVDHAFWVPEWKLKEFIGRSTSPTATVTPDKTGTYQVICTQSCGILHLGMRAKVVVEPSSEFERWAKGLHQKVPPHLVELKHLDAELEAIHEEAGNVS
jgi:cytochrome c oxidase subunit II